VKWKEKMSHRISDLKAMSDEELVLQHDKTSSNTVMGVQYFLDELRGRENERIAQKMATIADRMWWLSVVVSVATIVGTVFAVLAYYK
jgi:CHASE3 domain sensor protein